ncbi:MAG: AraC family transcriptional regulator [Alphaproteobacteria bacterium]|nr:AraC family transcriptional regulator [Alphaproteobacteria bacterium]
MLNAEIIGEFERQYLSLEANSTEEVSQWVSRRHKGFRSFPLEKPQPGPVARFARATVDEVSLVNFRWFQACQSELLDDMNAYFVCIPHAGKMKMQLGQKTEIVQTTENLRVFKRQAGLKNTVGPGFSNLSLIVPASLLEKRLENWIGDRAKEPLDFSPLVDVNNGSGAPVVSLISHMLTLLNSAPGCLDNELIKTNIMEHLMSVLIESLPHNYRETAQAGSADVLPKSVRRAEDYMRAHCDQPITLTKLARVAGCSERGLQNAFKTHRQAGPMAVLRDIRLEAAHSDILHTECTVTEIAFKWGFSNLGRFSKIFAEKFGECPSRIARSAKHGA